MAPASTTPTTPAIPAAPAHMSTEAAKQWTAAYAKTFAQAQKDYPTNPTMQRSTALKAANALLAVPAPTSAADIDKLESWQVLTRETKIIKGVPTRLCVTTDGRKYSFPLPAPAAATAATPAATGNIAQPAAADKAKEQALKGAAV